jgi:ubiquinone/menaquinone biosynthesis C-methylase UbiE
MRQKREHWNQIFRETEDEQLGWYENDPAQTLRLLNRIPEWESSTFFLPGAGTSVLIETLLEAGSKLVLNDISQEALDHVRERLGDQTASIKWICQDVAHPLSVSVPEIDIWIDRAVLHFLTQEDDIQGYFKNMMTKLKVGGHALFAEFPPHGAPKCAGLELHRYSLEEMSERLGFGFVLIDHFDHTYTNPAGDSRPYLYALFKREA